MKPLSHHGEGVRNLDDHLLVALVEGVGLRGEGGHAGAVVGLAQVTQVANLGPRVEGADKWVMSKF